ncbi:response regulator [Pseudomonas caspiana]|uniref:Two-component system response regulator n=1 Tax=Pseudomonas caspiana TaxID=1451454 RepID=A0A1Y3P5N1_9PSED|nr:response regulator [Pseudomonas caspiana]OUM75156.1 two-component system response regulator [Pseudomonas caspiana]
MLKPILLVEDNPNDRELTLIALQRSNLANEVVIASDGAEALDYLFRRNAFADRDQGNPAFILLDLRLPKVNGLDVLKAIKADIQLQTVPVAMLTSSDKDTDLDDAYKLGVNSYLVKPVVLSSFVAAVTKLGMFWAVLNEQPPGTLSFAPQPDKG